MADLTTAQPTRARSRFGLGTRVAAVSLALLATWWLAYSMLIAPRIRSSFQREQEARIELLSRAIGTELDHLLASATREIERIAVLPALRSMDAQRIDEVLARQDVTSPTFLHFFVLDAEGRIVSRPSKPARRGADRSSLPYFSRARHEGRTHIGEVRRSTAGNRSLVIGTPIRDEAGSVAGVLAGSLGLMDRNEHVYALITDPTTTRWPADVFLLSRNGEVLASSLELSASASLGVVAAPAGAATARDHAVLITEDGKRWLASATKLDKIDWLLFVRVPASLVDEDAAAITRTITIASLALFIAALAIGLAFTGWLVGPLNRLSTRLRTYGREGAAPPIPVTGPRELQDAAVAFNAMVDERERALAERDELEQQLRQSQKLQIVGTLASGIAHDFNNLLTPIVWGASLLDRKLPADSELRASVDNIRESAARATGLIERILTFSQSSAQTAKRVPVDLARLVGDALQLAAVSVPSTISLETEIDPNAGTAMADAAQLHQVILNLCKNAADAIGESSGTVALGLHRSAGDDAIVLEIRDDGCGMDADTLSRTFDPFFTTKAPGKGTGLGMSVVHGIITDHGGHIEIESAPGEGTCVRIALPRIEVSSAPEPQPTQARGERILLVDDDAPILTAAASALADLGYAVTTEQDSERALSRLIDAQEPYDLVVCDNNMPALTGCELIERAAAVRTTMPFLVITGVANQDLRTRCAALGVTDVLEKPLSLDRLAQAVREALERRT